MLKTLESKVINRPGFRARGRRLGDTDNERPAKVSHCPPVSSQVDPDLFNSTCRARKGSTLCRL